ncbi:Tetratricopeptide-like helical domain superfamily [Sesbania bispinosa]|nr:Tetratricopeptide-like helical domain superfamily [Sesbania bispinosa]
MEISSVAAFSMAFRHSPIPSLSISCSSTSTTTEPPHSQTHRKTIKFRNSKPFSSARLEVQQASDLPSALARVGDMLTVKDLNATLHHFGNSNEFNHISQLFLWMQENKKLDVSSYSHYVRFMANKLDAATMLKLYDSIQDESAKDNVYVCNSVLSCLIKKGKFDTAIKLFQQMKEDGLVPDVVTYSTLLAGCIKVKHGYPKALELIQELQDNKLRMDDVIYGAILAVCASNSKWEEAEFYFNQMKDGGHSPNVYHYSSLLNAYSACGNYKKADTLIQNMKSEGLVPNKVILTTLLKVYVRGGLFEKSRELLAELESLGYAEDEIPYCVLMDGLAKAGQIHEAKIVFDEMMKKHVRAGEMESVKETLRKMDKLAISPDYNTFHILIKYFCREKMYLLAYRTMEDMHSKGYQPVEELCSSLISHLGQVKAYSEAFSVYNMLKYSKRTMCKALHEKILHILIAGQLLKDAYVVVKDNATFISRPATKNLQDLFEMAVSRYLGQPEKKDLLLHLLQWMPGQGYVVNSSTRNLILKNSQLFGRQLIAEVLSKHQVKLKAQKSH